MTEAFKRNESYMLSALGLLGITGISLGAVVIQIILHELPCPLCLLQRAGIMAIGIGYMMNMKFGNKSRYYAVSTFACLFTMIFAVRQVLIHIEPGSGFYGDAVFGLHLYTWVVVIAGLAIAWNCLVTLYLDDKYDVPEKSLMTKIGNIIIWLYVLTIALNIVLTFLECGVGQCPDSPMNYLLLS
ncbi:disulfide bond formation protein B [Pseudofrancisella aestuarii]|uniref:Disulfide bond formation protein B n=1 Tax=Pseudofrancisella aestuarii TaxID=2670347 RepID=A0ABV9TCM5_9GAMM|nr:disulfide bond formation protein B [Pseudofrancisella aestuarii]